MLFFANDGRSWRLSQLSVAKKINSFLYSRYSLPVLALLAVIGHIFAIEMCVYWIYVAIVVYVCLFGRDFLLILPITVNCYIMPSHLNNPGKHAESIFFMENGAHQFVIMAAILLSAAIFRLIFDREIGFRNIKRVKFKLLAGMLALCAAYLLSGIGSENYAEVAAQNIRFALLQCVAVIVLYFLLSFTVKWEECDKRYLCYVLVLMGIVIGIEVLNIYRINEVIVNGSIDKLKIYVGWGISTNIGMHFALAIPAAFYLVYKGEGTVSYHAVAVLLLLLTILTTSRAAVLGACACYVLCVALVAFRGETAKTRRVTLIGGLIFLLAGAGALLSSDIISFTFSNGLSSAPRLNLYRFGLKLFREAPILGNGFFGLNDYNLDYSIWEKVEAFSEGFPDRWHNTIVQLLVSCGLCGLIAYLYHRYQTLKLFLVKINAEKIFVGIALSVLLGLSLVDCHFFNVGPVLIYSAALAFIEGTEGTAEMRKGADSTP